MNYQKTYNLLIAKARANPPAGYCEVHHIVPRCLGGTDDPSNLIRLSARQHFVAHLLLAKAHGGKMIYAAWRMKNGGRHTNKEYEWLRQKHSNQMAEKWRGNQLGRGRIKSQDERDAIAARFRGHRHNVGRVQSAGGRKKKSLALIGNRNACGKKTPEHVAKVVAATRLNRTISVQLLSMLG